MSGSDPRKYSGTAGCEETTRKTCLVTCFCCLFDGLPSWTMSIRPCASGYFSSSSGVAHRSWIAATCLVGMAGAGGALWAMVPTAMLVRGCAAVVVDRLFSSESSMKRLQFLRVCPDLSSPRSFLNPCSVHGPSSCSLAERYARASARGCLDLQSRF